MRCLADTAAFVSYTYGSVFVCVHRCFPCLRNTEAYYIKKAWPAAPAPAPADQTPSGLAPPLPEPGWRRLAETCPSSPGKSNRKASAGLFGSLPAAARSRAELFERGKSGARRAGEQRSDTWDQIRSLLGQRVRSSFRQLVTMNRETFAFHHLWPDGFIV